MQLVLVVGASGNLGGKIVRELLARGAAVRATFHKRQPPPGVEAVQADLADPIALTNACAGVHTVVSAVQGLGETILDGQTSLLHAAEAAGVARMIPSDYSVDFFKTEDGGNRNLDLRRAFNQRLDGSKVRGTSVLNGAFMDLVEHKRIGPDGSGVMRVYGDPDQPYDFTHTDDVAKYVAAVALDDSAGRVVRVVGDRASANQLAALRGGRVERMGGLDELSKMIAHMMSTDPAPHNPFPVWQQLQYLRDMARGDALLEPIDNARYPDIVPRKLAELA